jgi:EthD domain
MVPLPAGPRPQIVGLSIVMRPDSVPEADFRSEWIVVHGPMAKKVPYLHGFTVSQRLSDSPVPGVPVLIMDGPLDGFTESWGDDVEARAKMVASPQAKEWYAHGAEIFGKIRTDLLIEHVMQPVGL